MASTRRDESLGSTKANTSVMSPSGAPSTKGASRWSAALAGIATTETRNNSRENQRANAARNDMTPPCTRYFLYGPQLQPDSSRKNCFKEAGGGTIPAGRSPDKEISSRPSWGGFVVGLLLRWRRVLHARIG